MNEAPDRADGAGICADVLSAPAPDAGSPLAAAYRDFVFGEVWSRPGLDRRARFFTTLTCVGAADATGPIHTYVRAALASDLITLEELDEFVLHFAAYCGWPKASYLQATLNQAAAELNAEGNADIAARTIQPLQSPRPAEDRFAHGKAMFERIMTVEAPPRNSAFFHAGVLNFVFGEMWTRPGLDQRSRRFITVAGVAVSDAAPSIFSHVYAAMRVGDISYDEMGELALHLAVYSGWAKAEALEDARGGAWELIRNGQDIPRRQA